MHGILLASQSSCSMFRYGTESASYLPASKNKVRTVLQRAVKSNYELVGAGRVVTGLVNHKHDRSYVSAFELRFIAHIGSPILGLQGDLPPKEREGHANVICIFVFPYSHEVVFLRQNTTRYCSGHMHLMPCDARGAALSPPSPVAELFINMALPSISIFDSSANTAPAGTI